MLTVYWFKLINNCSSWLSIAVWSTLPQLTTATTLTNISKLTNWLRLDPNILVTEKLTRKLYLNWLQICTGRQLNPYFVNYVTAPFYNKFNYKLYSPWMDFFSIKRFFLNYCYSIPLESNEPLRLPSRWNHTVNLKMIQYVVKFNWYVVSMLDKIPKR